MRLRSERDEPTHPIKAFVFFVFLFSPFLFFLLSIVRFFRTLLLCHPRLRVHVGRTTKFAAAIAMYSGCDLGIYVQFFCESMHDGLVTRSTMVSGLRAMFAPRCVTTVVNWCTVAVARCVVLGTPRPDH